ncbi:MAG: protein kinase [Caldilineaceae bacterium]
MSRIKPGSRIGPFPYRILKPLGSGYGNMSDVYLASTGALDAVLPSDQVVLKISKAQDEHQDFYKDTIYNESERLRQLRHPGIVRILPIQTDNPMRQLPYAARAGNLPDNPWFLVLEYLAGGSLTDLINQHGKLQVALALQIARSIAETLDYIHRNDQVHLDIKPENILFRRPLEAGNRIEPVLIDFGIARNTGQEGLEARTLFYAPPERVQLNRSNVAPERLPKPQPSMDVYSLGVVIYQMVTGRRPFDGRSDKGISSAILAGNPTEPSRYAGHIPPTLETIILQTMHRDPLSRPTAGELVQQLENLIAKSGATPQSVVVNAQQIGASAGWRWRKRLRPVVALFMVMVLFVITLEAVSILQTGRTWPASQPGVTVNMPGVVTRLFALFAGPVAIGDAAASASIPPAATVTPAAPTLAVLPTDVLPSETVAVVTTPAQGLVETATAPPTTRPSLTPTATASPTPTATASPRAPTSTPVDDGVIATLAATNTFSAVTKATVNVTPGLAMSTPVPERTPTKTPTAPAPTATTKPAAPPPPKIARAVQLVAPEHGASGRGKVEFRWQANFTLQANQAFEPIFWRQGQDPLVSGLGWGGTTTGTSKIVDFDVAAPDTYLWGVLLVETNPYKRLQYLGGEWSYAVQGSGNSDSSTRGSGGR